MSRIGTINIIQNYQDVANNTSSITVEGIIITTGDSYRGNHRTGTYTIKQGNTVLRSETFTHGAPANSTTTLFSVTLPVTHDANGNSGTISASYNYDSGWASGTASKTLTTIPRKSTLSVGNGTLDSAQTLSVTRLSTSFTHTITATCGSASTTICTKSTSTSMSFTPPLSWASQNTTGTSVSVTYTITTYSGNTSIGSNSYTKTCAIPASVKPSCSIAVTDSTGYSSKYGGYIKGLSKFGVVITPTIASGSPIASYSTTANGSTYTSASFTTDVLKKSGSLTVVTTVKDKRGRTGTDSETLTVIDYAPPIISSLKVLRCNEDGTSNDQGEWVKVTINARITALNNKNTATYKLEYKKSADSNYTETDMTNLNNSYVVTDSELIFNADTGSSYDIRLTAIDDFGSTSKSTVASTAFSLMHFNADGTGVGFGKISELSNTADFGMDAKFNKNVYGNVYGLAELEAIPTNSDLNDYSEPGCYAIRSNVVAETISNLPVPQAGRIIVSLSLGWSASTSGYSYLEQKYIPYRSTLPVYTRNIEKYGSEAGYTYGEWVRETKAPSILFDGKSNGTITLPDSIDNYEYLEFYFNDNNDEQGGYIKIHKPYTTSLNLSITEAGDTYTYFRRTLYKLSGTTVTPDTKYAGYMLVNTGNSVSHVSGTNYLYITRILGHYY